MTHFVFLFFGWKITTYGCWISRNALLQYIFCFLYVLLLSSTCKMARIVQVAGFHTADLKSVRSNSGGAHCFGLKSKWSRLLILRSIIDICFLQRFTVIETVIYFSSTHIPAKKKITLIMITPLTNNFYVLEMIFLLRQNCCASTCTRVKVNRTEACCVWLQSSKNTLCWGVTDANTAPDCGASTNLIQVEMSKSNPRIPNCEASWSLTYQLGSSRSSKYEVLRPKWISGNQCRISRNRIPPKKGADGKTRNRCPNS